jgi:hypothetical protein
MSEFCSHEGVGGACEYPELMRLLDNWPEGSAGYEMLSRIIHTQGLLLSYVHADGSGVPKTVTCDHLTCSKRTATT